jgi:ATP-binding cassette subfamily B protein
MRTFQQIAHLYSRFRTLLPKIFRDRVPIVRQLSQTDSGVAALTMVLRYYGGDAPLHELRTRIGTGRSGTNAKTILEAASHFGLRGQIARLKPENFNQLPTGSILHWQFSHFVVFERLKGDTIHIVDPAFGRRVVPFEQVRRAFTGIAILFEPDTSFRRNQIRQASLIRLLPLFLESRTSLWKVICGSFVVQLLSAAAPLVTGAIVDQVLPRRDSSLLMVFGVVYVSFQVMSVITAYLRSVVLVFLKSELERKFTFNFLDHLIRLPFAYFQQHPPGDIMIRFGSNSFVRDIFTSAILSTLLDGIMASVYLVAIFTISRRLTLLVLILALCRLCILSIMRWKQRQFLSQGLENQAEMQTSQIETLGGMETLKSMGIEPRAVDAWRKLFVQGQNIDRQRGKQDALYGIATGLVGASTTLVLIFYGSTLVMQSKLTLGSMMAFAALSGSFMGPIGSLVSTSLQLQTLEMYLERVNEVLDTPREQDDEVVDVPGVLTGRVELTHVSFRYETISEPVIRDLSFVVEPGMFLALIGKSGSGKSTLARLIAGLYKPSAGTIYFDGKDLDELDLRLVRSQLGIATQEAQLFGGSIRRNIALADPSMTTASIVTAAKLACIHEDILKMSSGYETILTDRGVSLSGGQRQRLAVARAIAASPKILILDEATSHLDTLTEQKLNDNLATLKCSRIVIAHRLSTIYKADIICTLDSGRIEECGTHNQLMRKEGLYSALWRAQNNVSSDESSK